MAKDKVITVMCAARLPELLVKRMDAAAASGGVSRAQFIAEACRMRLDGPIPGRIVSVGTIQPPDNLPPLPYVQVESTDYVGLERKPDIAALRAICAGKGLKDERTLDTVGNDDHGALSGNTSAGLSVAEIPICGKKWWEDGQQYECLMDAVHREQKHGMRGMVRRLDA